MCVGHDYNRRSTVCVCLRACASACLLLGLFVFVGGLNNSKVILHNAVIQVVNDSVFSLTILSMCFACFRV